VLYQLHLSQTGMTVMTLELDKGLLTGAVFTEIVRQHPDIQLSSSLVMTVLSVTDEICKAFTEEAGPVDYQPNSLRHTSHRR